ncbi:MAG: hypothetical protein Q9217_004464 [Psora testacea]
MTPSAPSSTNPSRAPTPNRFTTQASTAEDLLKSQTVGLVHLSDFRKRRAEALEQKEREASSAHGGRFIPGSSSAGAVTPNGVHSNGVLTPQEQRPKKRQKAITKGKLSFGVDDEEHDEAVSNVTSTAGTPAASMPTVDYDFSSGVPPGLSRDAATLVEKKRLGPNASVSMAPKTITKGALLRESQTREQLRKEFLVMQEVVKSTEIVVPFVFYDGTNIPGGACKVKKGDHIWLFLDRSRKVGAGLGARRGEKSISRKEWARVGVDDLMLVRGEVIIPHHYEVYYFIINKTLGPNEKPLFDYASTLDIQDFHVPSVTDEDFDPLSLPSQPKARNNGQVTAADNRLEGVNDDPNFTKVVDRRWYERNKHIFPASVWEEYDPGKDYSKGVRKDAEGNAFFFS